MFKFKALNFVIDLRSHDPAEFRELASHPAFQYYIYSYFVGRHALAYVQMSSEMYECDIKKIFKNAVIRRQRELYNGRYRDIIKKVADNRYYECGTYRCTYYDYSL